MAILLAFAFLSGLVTIISPCILPVLPIALSSGASGGKGRPLGVTLGFAAGFAIFTLTLSTIVSVTGIPPDALRVVAVVTIILAGLVTAIPALASKFEVALSRLASKFPARAVSGSAASGKGEGAGGFTGGFVLGLGLSLVWTPCVGPIMASVMSLAISSSLDSGAVIITIAYTLGASIPMFAVMFGGRRLAKRLQSWIRHPKRFRAITGAVMVLSGIVLGLQWDRRLQAALLAAFPGYGAGLVALESGEAVRRELDLRRGFTSEGSSGGAGEGGVAASATPIRYTEDGTFAGVLDSSLGGGILGDYGKAPALPSGSGWIADSGFDLEKLRGNVIIVDFWTYSCINCLRTIPTLAAWSKAYADSGLVIIGAHSPEFAFERSRANVERAMRDLGVDWPVYQDNDFALWHAFGNQYWPAQYFIDAKGRVRYWHFGEGGYAESEKVLRSLLAEIDPASAGISKGAVTPAAPAVDEGTPELYLGYSRGKGFFSAVEPVADAATEYSPAGKPGVAQWSLEGRWTIRADHSANEGQGRLLLGFDAKEVYLVIEPASPGASLEFRLDGAIPADTADVKAGRLVPTESRLYHLVSLPERGGHLLEITVKGALRVFAFTFG